VGTVHHMTPPAHHHVGLTVDDLELAVAFYVGVFDAELLVAPITMGPPGAAAFMNGPAELSYDFAIVALPGSSSIELFRFPAGELAPDWLRPNAGLMPSMGIQVDDVTVTAARAEAAGGTRLWPALIPFGRAELMYVQDPFGNTIELIDVSLSELVADLHDAFPESKP
jgi:catechol 2,3-dioxygenase-like lactoylglutathione lyase family enzyme